ncbi:TPA: DUF5983 family protein [Escherichia coli]|uniref:DUF5983 family protein n=1 Tax=Escherichia coli TaxID=562 RepID=UPI00288975AF|nr:DUF5983 family protein [Escherichia coli]
MKDGAVAENTTVNQKGKLQVNAGGTATHVTLKQGGALVTSTAATVLGSNRLGNFTVENGKADGVVLESGGRLDVLEGHSAQKTRVDDGGTAHITETDNAWLYSLSHQTSDFGESEWIHFTGSGYLLRTDAWSYPVLRLKRLGLSKTFRRLVVTLIRRYGVSLIHLDASAECLPGLPTFDW